MNEENLIAIENLEIIFNTSPDAVLISRLSDGIIIRINDGFTASTGFTREDVIGKSSIDINLWNNPADRIKFTESFDDNGTCQNFEALFQRKDKSLIAGSISAKIMMLQEIPHVISVTRDISEKKRAASEIIRAKQLLEMALLAAGAGTWDWDIPGHKLQWSDELYALFGLDKQGTMASFESWTGALHPDDRELAASRIEEAIKNKTPLSSEYRIVHPGGEIRWISALGDTFYDTAGEPLRMTGICIDITDRRRAEEELRIDIAARVQAEHDLQESRNRYRDLANLLPQIIFETDHLGNLTYLNKQAYKMFGYDDNEQVLGKPSLKFHIPEERDRVINSIKERIAGRTVPDNEYTMLRKDGSTFPALVYSQQSVNDTGLAGLRGIIVDISERKKAEEVIKKMNLTLEQRVKERTQELETMNTTLQFHINEIEQFTYVTSHDLQEPLRTLSTFSQLLTDGFADKLDDDGNKYIEFIYKSSIRMSTLVKGLLDYALLGQESAVTLVDCSKIMQEVIADMNDSIEKSGAIINYRDLPEIYGYETELRMLFQNLLGNSLKFKKAENIPVINAFAEKTDKQWYFTFEDNGIGIEEKDKEKIFVIFKRMHNRSDYEGTGIGLAHCKKIVELHHGRIWVESAKDGGSKFRFTIPVSGF